ncbi:AAA family ATPase [Promicromonospora panici]|uniref:AAA family ATPase n=1 Tax=Promicromonospora panici TaxID=2219658 RepID=UPI001A91DFD5|nr:ATP-binding protein [Promicromonospora panici]
MGTSHDAAGPLVGRRRERQLLDGLVADVRRGRSRSLLVRGPAGVGKTALLDAAASAPGMQVLRVDGVESELELAFAGVHQACAPIFELMDRVPVPQRDALSIALGLQPGEAPDRFLIGLAVLSLLHEASAHQPVLLVVDDLQWLDAASAHTLVFVARRLPPAAAVGIVFGRRDDGASWPDQGVVPELTVARLTDTEARILFDELFTGPVDDAVRDRVVAETEGNPLAMVQLARQVTPEELAGGYGLPGTGSPANRVEIRFAAQVAALPAATQTFLQVAAAEPGKDTGLVLKAAAACGVGPTDAEPAVAAGLMDVWGPVRFRHPLARSAVYRAASPEQRRAAHAALADAVDAADPERRAWHRAHAAAGPDEEVAAELERCASRAEGRGGAAAGAAFREKAAELTPDAALRVARALHAAQVKLHARAPRGHCDCWPWRTPARATSSRGPPHSSCGRRSPSPCTRGRTGRCCRPPAAWSRSTRGWPGRRTGTRSRRHAPRPTWRAPAACGTWPPRCCARRLPRSPAPATSTCSRAWPS